MYPVHLYRKSIDISKRLMRHFHIIGAILNRDLISATDLLASYLFSQWDKSRAEFFSSMCDERCSNITAIFTYSSSIHHKW